MQVQFSNRIRRVLIAIGLGTAGLIILGLLDNPRAPSPPSTFWKEQIPSVSVVSNVAYSNAIAEARRALMERMQYFGTPGASVAVSLKSEIIWAECFGYADIARRELVAPTTKFRVGSVSKPFTAAAIARLCERGKLKLDAPIHDYLPAFPRKTHSFTIRQLAGHLAGIGKTAGQTFVSTKNYGSVNQALTEFQNDPLVHAPGTKFRYSGNGYTILSAAIESATGSDFLTAMDDLVFKPLLMTNTCADKPHVPNVTTFYDNYTEKGRWPVIAVFHDHSRSWAAGGFLSTPLDMLKFSEAHLTGGFLNAQTVATLFTPQSTTNGKSTGYGIGWSLPPPIAGQRQVRHLGDTVGGQAFLVLFPDAELVIALACTGTFWNYNGDGSSGATDRLAQIFLRDMTSEAAEERANLEGRATASP